MVVCCLPSLKPLFSNTSARKMAERLPSWASIRSLLPARDSSDSEEKFSGQQLSEQEKELTRIEVTRTVDQYRIPRG